jgi:uncharacterized membrane protein YdjX (TVP38/TMEM64 family)
MNQDNNQSSAPDNQAPPRKGLWKPIALLAFVIIMLGAAKYFGLADLFNGLKDYIEGLGVWGPVVFVAIYVAATVAALPGSALTLIAGAIFGSILGVIVVSVASTCGAALCFLIARYFARDAAAGWLESKESFRKLDRMTKQNGAIIVAITRLVPLFPFNLLNYGFGLTSVSFGAYVLWSWLCMIPGTILYVVGSDALAQGLTQGRIPWTLIGAFVVILVVLTFIVRFAKNKLKSDN